MHETRLAKMIWKLGQNLIKEFFFICLIFNFVFSGFEETRKVESHTRHAVMHIKQGLLFLATLASFVCFVCNGKKKYRNGRMGMWKPLPFRLEGLLMSAVVLYETKKKKRMKRKRKKPKAMKMYIPKINQTTTKNPRPLVRFIAFFCLVDCLWEMGKYL